MKLFPLISALTLAFSLTAQATSPITFQQEVLTKVSINEKETPYVGVLNLNFVKNTMEIAIYNDMCRQFTAQPGEITCMAMAQLITTIEAPLQSREKSCGSFIYRGEKDDSPVDGLHTKIWVADHSHRLCKDKVAGEIEVRASQFNPWTQLTTTYELVK